MMRLARLGTPSYWLDEAIQVRTAMAPTFMESMLQVPLNKSHLFYVIEFLVSRLSVNEWFFRMPSCLAGIAAIFVMWGLTKALYGSQRVALCAAGFLAVSPLHIQYSQEARPYALAFLLATGGVWAMFALMKAFTWRRFLATAVLPALSGWTLYFGIGLLGLQMLWVGGILLAGTWPRPIRHFREIRRTAGQTLIALTVSSSLLLPLFLRISKAKGEGGVSLLGAPMITLETVSMISEWLAFDAKGPTVLPIAAGIVCLALTGTIYGLWRKPAATMFLIVWILVLQGIQVAAYVRLDHWISARYHLIYLPPMLILSSVGCIAVLSLGGFMRKWVVPAMAVLLLALACTATGAVERWRIKTKPDIREVVRTLGEHAKPGDLVIGSGNNTIAPYQFYAGQSNMPTPPICDFKNLPETIAALQQAERLWIVYHKSVLNNNGAALRRLDPTLPLPMPEQPILRVIQGPVPVRDLLMGLERFQPALMEMELELPALLTMGDHRIASLLDRKWSRPKEKHSRTVRWMRDNKGTLVFWLNDGDAPTNLTIRFLPFFREDRPVHGLGIWWDDTLLLETFDLKRKVPNTIVTAVPRQSGEAGFHVLRFTRVRDVREAGLDPLEDPHRLRLAFIDLELR